MPLPPSFYTRLYNFRQADFAGQTFNPAWVDSELDRVRESINAAVTSIRGITDANGRLKLQQPLREMKLIETLTYVATAGQTQFYVAPITDPTTDRVQLRIQAQDDRYEILDQIRVSLTLAVAAGDVTATLGSNTYTFSGTLPDPLVGAALTINGTSAGVVTARLGANTAQTTTPWPLATVTATAPTWAWGLLGVATATPNPPLTAGQKVQADLFSDGAGALSQLATAGPSTGARMVAIYDPQNLYGATNVEDALQEVATLLSSLIVTIGPISAYLRADGTIPMLANLDFNGFTGANLTPAMNPGEPVEYSQFAAFVGVWNNLQAYYLKIDGTVPMAGPLNMGGKEIVSVADGTAPNSVASVGQVEKRLALDGSSIMTGTLNMGGKEAINAAPATAGSSFPTLDQVVSLLSGGSTLDVKQNPVTGQTFVVPAGVSQLVVEAWSAGGGGAAANWAGGGGGGYILAIVPVTSGETLTYDIPAGGAAGAAGGTFELRRNTDVLLRITGGAAGAGGNAPGAGGVPSSPFGLDFFGIEGGRGHGGWEAGVGSWVPTLISAGDGGSAPRGGAGGHGGFSGQNSAGGTAGTPGIAPGGAGAGNLAGANGAMLLRY